MIVERMHLRVCVCACVYVPAGCGTYCSMWCGCFESSPGPLSHAVCIFCYPLCLLLEGSPKLQKTFFFFHLPFMVSTHAGSYGLIYHDLNMILKCRLRHNTVKVNWILFLFLSALENETNNPESLAAFGADYIQWANAVCSACFSQ